MRELIAKGILLLTLALIVGLAMIFSARHNRFTAVAGAKQSIATPTPEGSAAQTPERKEQAVVIRGRMVFSEEGCSICHSVGGIGNPRHPLDGVGTRQSAEELRMWITGTGRATGQLPAGIQRRKQRYLSLPQDDLSALIEYLSSLKSSSP